MCLFQEFFCFRKLFIFFSLRQSVSRAPLFRKTIYLFQPQAMFGEALGAKWGTLGPWEAQTEAVAIALNQKVMDTFLKVCVEEGGGLAGGASLWGLASASCKSSNSSGGWAQSPSFSFINGRKHDLCRRRRPTIYHCNLSHRLSNSLMPRVQDVPNHILQTKSIYRNLFWPM